MPIADVDDYEEEGDHSQQFGIGMSRDIDHYRLLLECLMCQIDFGRAERIEERVSAHK